MEIFGVVWSLTCFLFVNPDNVLQRMSVLERWSHWLSRCVFQFCALIVHAIEGYFFEVKYFVLSIVVCIIISCGRVMGS